MEELVEEFAHGMGPAQSEGHWAAAHIPNFPVLKKLDRAMSSYSTPKWVTLQDRRLAVFNRLLEMGIFTYIVVYCVMYRCLHLKHAPIHGNSRITVQQPTEGCNPMLASCNSDFAARNDLAYCVHGARGSPTDASSLNCIYRDGPDLTTDTAVPGTFFVLSREDTVVQARECEPDTAADYGCNTTIFRSPVGSERPDTTYIADIERFTLLFGHGFEAGDMWEDRHFVRGQGTDVGGYVHTPTGPQLIPRVANGTFAYPSMFRLEGLGDVISVADLLKSCVGEEALQLDSVRDREHNRTLRWQGGIVEVGLEYSNKEPWAFLGGGPMTYIMSARLLPVAEFKFMYGTVSEDGQERKVINAHGILIDVRVGGDYHYFDWVYLIETLMASFALFAVSRMVVDFFMAYTRSAKKYSLLKYQSSSSQRRWNDREDKTRMDEHVKEILLRLRQHQLPRNSGELLMLLYHLDFRLNHLDVLDQNSVTRSKSHGLVLANLFDSVSRKDLA